MNRTERNKFKRRYRDESGLWYVEVDGLPASPNVSYDRLREQIRLVKSKNPNATIKIKQLC
jgi:hypothetical protein